MKTREQQRAHDAFAKIDDRKNDSQKARESYGRVCVHLPEMIHRNGLCQTVAFLEAKGADAQRKPWFGQALADLENLLKFAPPKGLAAKVRTAEMAEYQRLTHEALACAQWLKRYAEAVLKVDPAQKVGDDL